VLIFDGHENNPTCEGPKFYKQNGYYYVFFPAGGVKDGWQMVIRSKSVYGPYEARRVLEQGKSNINGPHQGAWVHTPFGEDWFIHFQELKPLGRVVLLQPMSWKEGWPVIGIDKDGNGCGEPVETYRKPKTDRSVQRQTPVESDEFNTGRLGKQWQWYANPDPTWAFFHGEEGFIRLFTANQPENYVNLLNSPNLLLQKFPAPDFTATAKVCFHPASEVKGEKGGLAVVGLDYAGLSLSKGTDGALELAQFECKKADRGSQEVCNEHVPVQQATIYLRLQVKGMTSCNFSYSLDGEQFRPLGKTFAVREGMWIGAKVGFFSIRPETRNDGGWLDVDWIRITR
jgi:beta-xylosidase